MIIVVKGYNLTHLNRTQQSLMIHRRGLKRSLFYDLIICIKYELRTNPNLTKLNGSKSVSGNNLIKIKANNYADLLTKILVNPKSTTYKDQATINFTEVGDGLSALKDLCNNGVKEFIGYTIVNQDTFTIPFDTSKGDTKVIVYSPIGKTSYSIKGSC